MAYEVSISAELHDRALYARYLAGTVELGPIVPIDLFDLKTYLEDFWHEIGNAIEGPVNAKTTALYFQGKRVNREWHAVLTEAIKKISFRLNSGWRTLAEQWYLYRLYLAGKGNRAAYPNPNAPHITYRHACDVNALDGGANRLVNWLRSKGVSCGFTVSGEPWHVGILNWAAFVKLADKVRGGNDPTLKQGQVGPSVVRLKKLLYTKGVRNFSGATNSNRYNPYFSKYTKAAVKRFQKANHLTQDGIVGSATWRALHR